MKRAAQGKARKVPDTPWMLRIDEHHTVSISSWKDYSMLPLNKAEFTSQGPKISDELRVPQFLEDLYVRCFLLRCVTSFLYHGDYNLASKLFATWIAEHGSTEAMRKVA